MVGEPATRAMALMGDRQATQASPTTIIARNPSSRIHPARERPRIIPSPGAGAEGRPLQRWRGSESPSLREWPGKSSSWVSAVAVLGRELSPSSAQQRLQRRALLLRRHRLRHRLLREPSCGRSCGGAPLRTWGRPSGRRHPCPYSAARAASVCGERARRARRDMKPCASESDAESDAESVERAAGDCASGECAAWRGAGSPAGHATERCRYEEPEAPPPRRAPPAPWRADRSSRRDAHRPRLGVGHGLTRAAGASGRKGHFLGARLRGGRRHRPLVGLLGAAPHPGTRSR